MSEKQNKKDSRPLEGLDPAELFARGMHSTAGGGGSWEPPTVEELAGIISGYEIIDILGRGGMGAVYQVFQPDLHRKCALKILPLEVSLEPGFEERFLQEARAMARLDHPNIVTIYDFGRSLEGHLFYVMEYIEGVDLYRLIADGGLDLAGALDVITQVCEGLEYAHAEGYVHRDIKPANILVGKTGKVKITDFGLAKLLRQEAGHGNTMTGTVMGTPDYMAPEQAAGKPVDHRADIYALGVMLYEMLTGSLPKGVFGLPSHKVRMDVRLDKIVIRALQQEPEKRYQYVSEVKTSLSEVSRGGESPPPGKAEPDVSPGKSRSLLLAAAAIAIFAGLVFLYLKETPESAPLAETAVPEGATKVDSSLWPSFSEKHVNTQGVPLVPVSGTDVLFSIWETRAKDWDKFVRETDHPWEGLPFNSPGDHPALNISWHDANAYCQWLTEKERSSGYLSPEMEYRLPTDLEWSAAVGLGKEDGKDPETRSGKIKGVYPWGEEWPVHQSENMGIDSSEALSVAELIKIANLISKQSSKGVADDKLRDLFQQKKYPERVVNRILDIVPLFFDYPTEILPFALPFAKEENYNDIRIIILSKPMKKICAHEILDICDLTIPPWKDTDFLDRMKDEKFFEGSENYYLGTRLWEDLKLVDLVRIEGLATERHGPGEFKSTWNGYCSVIVSTNLESYIGAEHLQSDVIEKLLAGWQTRCLSLIDQLLPKSTTDWHSKIRPVDDLWENRFGLKGMAGSAREWVLDAYGEDGEKTLRGGALRSEARGRIWRTCRRVKTGWMPFAKGWCQRKPRSIPPTVARPGQMSESLGTVFGSSWHQWERPGSESRSCRVSRQAVQTPSRGMCMGR